MALTNIEAVGRAKREETIPKFWFKNVIWIIPIGIEVIWAYRKVRIWTNVFIKRFFKLTSKRFCYIIRYLIRVFVAL